MNYFTNPSRRHLKLYLTPEEIANLSTIEDQEEKGKEVHRWLETMLANSELQWVYPHETGDLTDCPILGILGEPTTEKSGPHGVRQCGHWDGQSHYQPILERWGYMQYETLDHIEELVKTGSAVLWNGAAQS